MAPYDYPSGSRPPNPWSVAGEGLMDFGNVLVELKAIKERKARQEEQDRIDRENRAVELHSRGYREIDPNTSQGRQVGRETLAGMGVDAPSMDSASLVKDALPTHLGGYSPVLVNNFGSLTPSPTTPGAGAGPSPLSIGSPPIAPPRGSLGSGPTAAGASAAPPRGMAIGKFLREGDRSAPQFEHVTGDLYLDREATPEARALRLSREEEVRRLHEVLPLLRGIAGDKAGAIAPLAVRDESIVRDLVDEYTPEAPTIRVGGRDFPATPEGEAAALAWDRRLNPRAPTRDPNQPTPTQERNATRRTALTRIENILAAGASREQVQQVMGTAYAGELSGAWTPDDVVRIEREVRARKGDGGDGERRRAIVQAIGKAPVNQLEEDIVAALTEGESPESIYMGLREAGQPEEVIQRARQYIGASAVRFNR